MKKLFKQIKFDTTKMEVTYKVLFVTEGIVEELITGDNKSFKVELIETHRKENELKDGTRKRWFQLLSRVLESQGISRLTRMPKELKEILKRFSDSLKMQWFDCIEEQIDAEHILVIPPSLTSIPDEKVREANEQIIEIYSKLGVNFKDIT